MKVEYPDYNSDSSALVKMYLSGRFGTDPNAVNPYVCSTFYAVDRFASFKTVWELFYKNGGIVIADRYTTSNMIHQAGKIKDISEKEKYLDWLWDLEFVKMQLPVPDKVLFLDVVPEITNQLMKNRKNKFDDNAPKDIHERNQQHLSDAYHNALFIANKYNWCKINCMQDNQIKSIEDIHELIYQEIIKDIKD
jgi:dTMP kinase